MAKDWDSSQLVNTVGFSQKFGTSSAVTVSIPPESSHTFNISVASVVAGEPCSVSPDKTLGADVGIYYRTIPSGVEVKLRNLSPTLAASLIAVTFKAVVIQQG